MKDLEISRGDATHSGGRADLNVAAITQKEFSSSGDSRKGTSSHQLRYIFGPGHRRKGDNSCGGTVFDVEFAQDVFDVLADRPGACAEDNADLIIRFTLRDQTQNLRFARGETQQTIPAFRRHWFSSYFRFVFLLFWRFGFCLE